MKSLTVKKVSALREPGMYSDGNGLYLRVGPSGGKSWILRTMVHGRRRELGLGSAQLVTLAEARGLAFKYRKIAREGGDPDTVRKRESLSFEEAARRVHQSLLPTWKNKKHADTWIATIDQYALPALGLKPLHTVHSSDILAILSPIWTEKPETAKRLKQRISTIFDWAKGAGHYAQENPVNGLTKALPRQKKSDRHMPSMNWQKVPQFVGDLQDRDGVSARTLEFIILTAVRSGEARGARWQEIEGDVWTIPGDRMKKGVEHRVPLSGEALEVLERVRGLDGEFVFPSIQKAKDGGSKPQSDMVFKALTNRMGVSGFTTHGFRSSFRDWCSESARVDREVAEAALAHSVGNAVEQAYARSDLIDRRRELMDAWGRYVSGKSGDVVEMVRA